MFILASDRDGQPILLNTDTITHARPNGETSTILYFVGGLQALIDGGIEATAGVLGVEAGPDA